MGKRLESLIEVTGKSSRSPNGEIIEAGNSFLLPTGADVPFVVVFGSRADAEYVLAALQYADHKHFVAY